MVYSIRVGKVGGVRNKVKRESDEEVQMEEIQKYVCTSLVQSVNDFP